MLSKPKLKSRDLGCANTSRQVPLLHLKCLPGTLGKFGSANTMPWQTSASFSISYPNKADSKPNANSIRRAANPTANKAWKQASIIRRHVCDEVMMKLSFHPKCSLLHNLLPAKPRACRQNMRKAREKSNFYSCSDFGGHHLPFCNITILTQPEWHPKVERTLILRRTGLSHHQRTILKHTPGWNISVPLRIESKNASVSGEVQRLIHSNPEFFFDEHASNFMFVGLYSHSNAVERGISGLNRDN